jgi:hypothetical protein
MKNILRQFYFILNLLGFNPLTFINFFRGLPSYFKDYRLLSSQLKNNSDFKYGKFYPALNDKFMSSGVMKGHYFYQDLLVARRIFEHNPKKHIDIGSRVDGFVAHVAVFRNIEIFDIRQLESTIHNIRFKQADLMKMQDDMIDYCDSISSLHAIEHFGLGRYGDPIDINGHIKAIDNIYMILEPQGRFYFSVPIGNQRIEFNAHRVFSIEYLLKIFENRFLIDFFSYVDDNGDFYENVKLTSDSIKQNFNCHYGCGIFELTKI